MANSPKTSKGTTLGETFIIVTVLFSGMVFGGYQGFRHYNQAVEEAVKTDGFADYLPVGIPILAFLGAVIGGMMAGLFVMGRRLAIRRKR